MEKSASLAFVSSPRVVVSALLMKMVSLMLISYGHEIKSRARFSLLTFFRSGRCRYCRSRIGITNLHSLVNERIHSVRSELDRAGGFIARVRYSPGLACFL